MSRRLPLGLVLALAIASPCLANWTATGYFQYKDRDWNPDGFVEPLLTKPIRYADVQVFDVNKTGNQAIIANTKTDANGWFSVVVNDSQTRTVAVRVLSSSTQTSDLHVKVVDRSSGDSGVVYKFPTTPTNQFVNHAPTVNVEFVTLPLAPGSGGEVFNIFDLGVYGADFIKVLTGSRPPNNKLVTFHWQLGAQTGTAALYNDVFLSTERGYDDSPILHEWAHYVMWNYSRATSPGGGHFLQDCEQDIGLAFDEGRASVFGAFVRRYYGMPYANWYIYTDGASGPGHMVNRFNMETATEYSCDGDTSEVTVARTLWDIGDSASTTDDTPGVDDNPPDALANLDGEMWKVLNDYLRGNVGIVSLEKFWDGWFDSSIQNGFKPQMTDIFSAWAVEFFEDANEPNNTSATATLVVPDGRTVHNTYFDDPELDGKGQADTDYFKFQAVSGTPYSIRTESLVSDANTNLELLDTNGSTVLATNDDQVPGDPSSAIAWTAPQNGVYYIRSTHSPDRGIYGSYDLVVSAPLCGNTACGFSFCGVVGDMDFCHHLGGGCSGDVGTPWNSCVEPAFPVMIGDETDPVLWTCPAGQYVHLTLCPCTCKHNACGDHYTVVGCQ